MSNPETTADPIVDYVRREPVRIVNVASHFGMALCDAHLALVELEEAGRIEPFGTRPVEDRPMTEKTTEMTDLEIAEEQLEEWQNACRKLERMNTDLRFALAAALPGLRDLVNQECPDPDVAERDQIVLRQALKALGKSA